MKQIEGAVWVKGWFDGDFSSLAGSHSDLSQERSVQQVVITRGRLSEVEVVDGPPPAEAGARPLFQRSVDMVHLDDPGQQGWIVQVHDLHIPKWSSVSTGVADESRAKEVGRLVGWAWARILPPRPKPEEGPKPRPDPGNPPKPSQPDPKDPSEPRGPQTDPPAPPEPPKPPEPPIPHPDPLEPPSDPHPCKLCGWGWPIVLFLLLWLSCKFSWALVGVLPFILRCALAQVGLPPREPWKQWAFSGAVVALALIPFLLLLSDAITNCAQVRPLWLWLIALAVVLSARLVHCWVPLLVALVWAVAALISCPDDPATCSLTNAPKMGQYVNERVEQSRQRINDVLRPDRDAEDLASQGDNSSDSGRPPTLSIDQAVKTPEKVFRCVDEQGKPRQNHQIYMGQGALFELNASGVNEEEARAQLVKLGQLIRQHPDASITIIGHADRAPHKDGPSGNLVLSEERASAVADWLVANGYAKAEKISAMGVGDRYPRVETQGEDRSNRRVEVRVQCPKESR